MEEFSRSSGDQGVLEGYSLIPQPSNSEEIYSKDEGFVTSIDARRIGLASQHAGAGRERKEDDIDLSAGLLLSKKVGDKVKPGMLLATVFGNDPDRVKKAAEEAIRCIRISQKSLNEALIIKVDYNNYKDIFMRFTQKR